jgi:hypothetical protein
VGGPKLAIPVGAENSVTSCDSMYSCTRPPRHATNPDAGGHPHVDCIQTFAHSEPASSHVLIDANNCEGLTSQCVMAEGPGDAEDGASGIGRSTDWLITGNYFECHAQAQTIQLQDIHDVTHQEHLRRHRPQGDRPWP